MLSTMILRPKPLSRHAVQPLGAAPIAPMATVPSWLRRAIETSQNLEDAAIAAGAAIGALDAIIRRQERWTGAWRQRLALAAAAVTARQAGRTEDEAGLRDAVLLARPGDFLSVGPAGLLLLAWRRLAARPAEDLLTGGKLAAVLEEFGHARDDEAVGDLADELRQLGASAGTVGTLTGAVAAAERYGFGRVVGFWLADALLAQKLGWQHAVPLLGAEASLGMSARPRRSATSSPVTGIETETERAKGLLAAQARAALRAIDLSIGLERRAERLLAVAPKLRAKGADAVVEQLLSDDALVASRGDKKTGMSDRGLRRLFDRLVELGAVRELSGRPTFRIYGL
ncbi:DUF1403 family protein [Mesorhizobium caraganae]|uniref:DUF1403 family protein n=1 Tax=Mesorhizobium caraganae TaxID=483206 RepID=UPI001FE98255|nr:DUF1403 family protein [Mesorhizobium caraganae]